MKNIKIMSLLLMTTCLIKPMYDSSDDENSSEIMSNQSSSRSSSRLSENPIMNSAQIRENYLKSLISNNLGSDSNISKSGYVYIPYQYNQQATPPMTNWRVMTKLDRKDSSSFNNSIESDEGISTQSFLRTGQSLRDNKAEDHHRSVSPISTTAGSDELLAQQFNIAESKQAALKKTDQKDIAVSSMPSNATIAAGALGAAALAYGGYAYYNHLRKKKEREKKEQENMQNLLAALE